MVRTEALATVAKAAGNSYSPHLQLRHQGSTLQISIFNTRFSAHKNIHCLEEFRPFGGNGINVMNIINHKKIKPGLHVLIVLKKDQRSGKLTEGIVKDILTKSPTHPHGIKVRLESGEIGRVKEILE